LIILILLSGVIAHSQINLCLAADTAQKSPPSSEEITSEAYGELVDEAIRLLVRGKSDEFIALLSPSLVARTKSQLGPNSIDTIVKTKFIPFFEDLGYLEPTITTTTTSDADGHKGIAFYRAFVTKDGDQKPFILYILEENGKLVVGNLLLNKTLRDVSDKGNGG